MQAHAGAQRKAMMTPSSSSSLGGGGRTHLGLIIPHHSRARLPLSASPQGRRRNPAALTRAAATSDGANTATTTTTTTTTTPTPIDRAARAAAARAADAARARALPLAPPAKSIPLLTNLLTSARVLREGPARWGLEVVRDVGPVARVDFLGRGDIYHVGRAPEIVDALARDGHAAVFEATESFQRLMADFTTESMTDGERRRAQRRTMAPGFSQDALREYVPVLDDILATAARGWAARCASGGGEGGGGSSLSSSGSGSSRQQQPAGTVEIQEELRLATIDVANGLLVGMRGLDARQKDRLQALMAAWFGGLTAPALDLPGSPFRRALEARQALIDLLQPMVAEQRPAILSAAREAGAEAAEAAQAAEEAGSGCPFAGSGLPGAPAAAADSSSSSKKKKKNRSILAFTAAARRELTGEDFTDLELTLQLMGLLLAGVDTSAGSFTLLVLALSQLPEVVAQLREEQRRVADAFAGGDLGAPLDKAMLDAMPYADAVAKEVQYLYPVAQIAMRTAKSDMAVGGVRVPEGATLLLNFASAQMAEALGGGDAGAALSAALPAVDPPVMDAAWLRRHFRPERWMAGASPAAAAPGAAAAAAASSSSSSSSSPPSPGPTLLAFSSGPHVCLGQQLYQLEARCLVARLVRHYDLELLADPAAVAGVWRRFGAPGPTQRCLWMRLTPRGEGEGQDAAFAGGNGVSAR